MTSQFLLSYGVWILTAVFAPKNAFNFFGKTLLLYYVTGRSEKLGFKNRILSNGVRKMLIFGDIKDHPKRLDFVTLIDLGKLCKIKIKSAHVDCYLRSSISWCNAIQ